MLRLQTDSLFTASQAIADAFAGFHLGVNCEMDGANMQRKIAVLKIVTLPTDGTTVVIGGKTYTFKNTVAAADQIKIGNLVTNGDFAAIGDSWINYKHWVIAAGKATHTAGAPVVDDTFTQVLSQEWFPKPIAGLTYTTTFTVTNRSAGSVTIKIGGASGTVRSADGTYVEAIVATGNGYLQFIPTADFDGEISAVTVTEPSTDLKGLTALALLKRINIDKATTLCTAYNSLGLTTLVALLANEVGVTPTLTPDGALVTKDIDWALVLAQAKLEDIEYWKRDISTDEEVKPTVLVERNAGTDKNYLY